MVAARIAAVFLAAFLPIAGGQQPAQTQLTVQVVDATGAVIPGARVEIGLPGPQPVTVLRTDARGQAAFDLPAGSHTLGIAAQGFKTWTGQIEVQNGPDQSITVKLDVASSGCSPCVVAVILPDIPLERPEPVFLLLQPVSSLAPLPSRRAKRRL
jgi:hypothetical protein